MYYKTNLLCNIFRRPNIILFVQGKFTTFVNVLDYQRNEPNYLHHKNIFNGFSAQ